jgi:PAS domain-containing protein
MPSCPTGPIYGAFRDLTELKRAEARLHKLMQEQQAILNANVVGF